MISSGVVIKFVIWVTYRERADGGGGELRKAEVLGLDFFADGEGAPALKVIGSDRSNTLADGIIGGGLEFTSLGNGNFIGLQGSGDLRVLGSREARSDDGDLRSLLQGEGEPILLLLCQFVLGGQSHRGVKEGRGGCDDYALLAKSINSNLCELDGSSKVSFPDVATGDKTEREYDIGVLDGCNDFLELTRGAVKVDVESCDG